MVFTHKIFLFWLLYFVLVTFGWGCLTYLQLPQIALYYDHSYLTYVLFGLYGLAELLSARQAWKLSKENQIADEVVSWFKHKKLQKILITDDGMALCSETETKHFPNSVISDHFSLLTLKANAHQKRIRQDTLIDVLADRLYERSMIGEFISSRIVWIGILATILGVIMAFWPMIGGASIESLKENLSFFFGGIAVAFIPTAVSFLFKIILDFNSKIIVNGVGDLIDKIAYTSETNLLPLIDNEKTDETSL